MSCIIGMQDASVLGTLPVLGKSAPHVFHFGREWRENWFPMRHIPRCSLFSFYHTTPHSLFFYPGIHADLLTATLLRHDKVVSYKLVWQTQFELQCTSGTVPVGH